MNPKFSSYLFTELIVKLQTENLFDKNEIYHELVDRLLFCKMDYNTAIAFIELEKLIVKTRNIKWNCMLYNKYWWLNEKLQLENQQQKKEIEYKEDIIIGLVDDISVADKRQILNRVVRRGGAKKIKDRWNALYREFDVPYAE